MGIYSVKPAFQRRLKVVRDFLIAHSISADAITLTALALSALGGVVIWAALTNRALFALVPLLAMSRIALNALDGMVAQATGSARPFGEVFNETSDRVSDVLWFSGLAAVIDVRLALGALVLTLISSYVGTVAKAAGGERIYTGLMGKADRMIVLSAGALISMFADPYRVLTTATWVIAAGVSVTIVQRLVRAKRLLS